MARLGLFNPKLLRHDYLKNINPEKLLKIKTSTWLKADTNKILIISHISSEIVKTPVFEIIPYPDEDNNILTEIYLINISSMKIKYLIKKQGKF